MIGKNLGDSLEGEKIILEAGHIDLYRNMVRAQGHHGDRSVGKIHAVAIITKPFASVNK